MSSIFSHGNSSILQVLDRGEKIELLVDKTDNLRSQVSRRRNLHFRLLGNREVLEVTLLEAEPVYWVVIQ